MSAPTFDPHIFREYDVRGRADADLADPFVEAFGRAYGARVRANGGQRVALGMDCRLSGPRIAGAFERGVRATGVDVVRLGVVPTPMVYFATHHLHLDGGVAITGSHNPPAWNGFKLCLGTDSLYGEALLALRDQVAQGAPVAAGTPTGGAVDVDLLPAYLDAAAAGLRPSPPGARPLRVVIDAGNGTGGITAGPLYRRLGYEVIERYVEPDGHFPHHHPDPTVEANLADLRATVAAHEADVGLAFDGDADRLGVIDRLGRVVWGDQLLLFFARAVLAEQPGARIIGEVKCSQVLYDGVAAAGGHGEMWKVGHSLIKARMRETGAPLAGEMSGHLFFADRWLGFDDATYAGARLLELLAAPGAETLDARLDALPRTVTTPELRVSCPDAVKFDVVARAAAHFRERYEVTEIDGVRVKFPHGWGLVRPSNTQPVLVLRFEADRPEQLDAYRAEVYAWLSEGAPEVDVDAETHH